VLRAHLRRDPDLRQPTSLLTPCFNPAILNTPNQSATAVPDERLLVRAIGYHQRCSFLKEIK
jgi:hypothetical protein